MSVVAEDGREVILSVLGAGSFFGELALLDDEPRSAHVIAMEDTVLLQLHREDFRNRLKLSPSCPSPSCASSPSGFAAPTTPSPA